MPRGWKEFIVKIHKEGDMIQKPTLWTIRQGNIKNSEQQVMHVPVMVSKPRHRGDQSPYVTLNIFRNAIKYK